MGRLRRHLCVVGPMLALLLAAAAPAHAYNVEGAPWPGRPARVAYFVTAPGWYRFAIAQGALAWNTSGARVRFVEVRSRSRARVVISQNGGIATNGYASIGYQSHNYVYLKRCAPGCADQFYMAAIVAHELGHVIGLGHVTRGCATMDGYRLWSGCPPAYPPQSWKWQCRLLMRDDIAGAVHVYGGRVRVRSGRWCDKGPAPRAVRAPRVVPLRVTPTRVARIEWTLPPGATSAQVVRRAGSCPTSSAGRGVDYVGERYGRPGQRLALADDLETAPPLLAPGVYCYRITPASTYDRPGTAVNVRVRYPGPPPVPAALRIAIADHSSRTHGFDTTVTVTTPRLRWLRTAFVVRKLGGCPTSPTDPAASYGGGAGIVDGVATIHDIDYHAGGSWCYAAFVADDFERASATALTASFVFTPPHAPDVSGLTATYDGAAAAVTLRWTWPADVAVLTADAFQVAGACPASAPDHDAQPQEDAVGGLDRHDGHELPVPVDGLAGGTWCYTVYTSDGGGFYGAGASAAVTLP